MQIFIDHEASNASGMFGVAKYRADVAMDAMNQVCETALEEYHDNYKIVAVMELKNGEAELVESLNIAKIMTKFISIAENENEKNYILYMSGVAIARLHDVLFSERTRI